MIVWIDPKGLDAACRALAANSERMQVAVARGLNAGGDRVRTQIRRAMREQTGLVQLQSVTKRQRTIRAFPGKLEYAIVFQGKPTTRPEEFRFRVKRGKGGGVSVWMWGVQHAFPRSFQIAGNTGGLGLRMRLGAPRFPVRSFDGPNLAKELGQGRMLEVFDLSTGRFVGPALAKAVAGALR